MKETVSKFRITLKNNCGSIIYKLRNCSAASTNETPDVFQVISFYSYEGTFESTYIDLGNGLVLDIVYNETDVSLIVVRFPPPAN